MVTKSPARSISARPSFASCASSWRAPAGFSRGQLLENVWGRDQKVELRTVDATIRRLRRTLNADSEADLLRTVHAIGYGLDCPSVRSTSVKAQASLAG